MCDHDIDIGTTVVIVSALAFCLIGLFLILKYGKFDD